MQDLGTLPGGANSYAQGINDSGQVVGYADTAGGASHAFLWTASGGLQDLGTLPGGSNSYAYAINNLGQVVGGADTAGGPTDPFLWTSSGGLQDLGKPPGNFFTEAFAINSSGQIVSGDFFSTAFLYQNGVMSNLNKQIGKSGSHLSAEGINDAGQIVGFSNNDNGEQQAYLLSPITATSTWLAINPQPKQSVEIYSGQNAQFRMAASSSSLPSYQWQRLPAGSSTWTNLSDDSTYSGSATPKLALNATNPSMSGDQFRGVVTSGSGSATTTASTLVVINPVAITISQPPQNQATAVGQTASFAVNATSSPDPSYQWQISTDGGTSWSDLNDGMAYSGSQNSTLQVSNTDTTQSGDEFRCIASDSGVNPTVTSPPATLAVYPVNSWNGWLLTTFAAIDVANPAIAGATATPANDGLSNFLKYAFNLDPFVAESGNLPQPGIVNGQLVLVFQKLRPDVTYTVEASRDLATWSTQGVVIVNNGNQITASYSLTGVGTAFMRIVLNYNKSL
jgi:probable HAF family extracellular repeat protein